MELNCRSKVQKISLSSYWRERRNSRKKSSPTVIRLGDRRKRWRLRPAVKVARLRILSPVKAMENLRAAYTDSMLLLSGLLAAGKGGFGASMETIWDRRIPRGREKGFKGGDFEKSFMLHLYNSVIANT